MPISSGAILEPGVKAAPYVTGVDRRTVVALVELGIRSLTTGGA
ncbi:MAG TPA: hypothetical protein VKF35_13590 [Hyphomicrobiaceae bacterium]|nr:hypothetical protein [Hyphomicrobiaceae bacterium]